MSGQKGLVTIATTTAVATVTTAAAAETATTTTVTAVGLGTGFVDGQRATFNGDARDGFDGRIALRRFDEAETAAAVGHAVFDDAGAGDFKARVFKYLTEAFAIEGVGQVAHEQFHFFVLTEDKELRAPARIAKAAGSIAMSRTLSNELQQREAFWELTNQPESVTNQLSLT